MDATFHSKSPVHVDVNGHNCADDFGLTLQGPLVQVQQTVRTSLSYRFLQ